MNTKLDNNELLHKWQCIICDFIYEEDKGLIKNGILPRTKFENLPDDWVCPNCGACKSDFFNMNV